MKSHGFNDEIVNYAWQRQKDGRAESTIKNNLRKLVQLSRTCNLLEPEEVKGAIAKLELKNSSKRTMATAYGDFLKYKGIKWDKPKYKGEARLPFIPLESEIDELIAATGRQTSALLQFLKETGARVGEASHTKWIDIDTERRVVRITPEKNSNPRILPISPKLITLLNRLPKTGEYLFNTNQAVLRNTYTNQRHKIAEKLSNPRLDKISFHTLRHWKGTMEYHKTQSMYHVKKILGHKCITNTEIYVNIEQAIFLPENSEYCSATATTIQEAQKLIETGFEYVTEMDGVKLFRKRK